jgi:hypothetical protein
LEYIDLGLTAPEGDGFITLDINIVFAGFSIELKPNR